MRSTEVLEFPRNRRRTGIFRKSNLIPLSSASISLLFLVQAWTRVNCWKIGIAGFYLPYTTLLEPSSAAALLATFIGLAFARSQFLYSAMPIFDYRIQPSNCNVSISEAPEDKSLPLVQIIDLHNSGQGVGIVNRARYWIELMPDAYAPTPPKHMDWFSMRRIVYGNENRFNLDFHEMRMFMQLHNYQEDEHWAAINFGSGSAFGPNVRRRIMVLRSDLAKKLVAFDLCLEYENALGDKDVMYIFMVPRRQF